MSGLFYLTERWPDNMMSNLFVWLQIFSIQSGGSMGFSIEIIIGSRSDESILKSSGMLDLIRKAGFTWRLSVISAHRNPEDLARHCLQSMQEGAEVFIGAAGMAAALPGAIASAIQNARPVIGVALPSDLEGYDALMSIVRMPPGMPVLSTGIGKAGLKNAAIAACQMLALKGGAAAELFSKGLLPSLGKEAEIGILTSDSSAD